MSKSNLRKKFFRGEKKISSQFDELDAASQIDLIKARPKKEDLPPPLPLEEILSHQDSFTKEISNILNRHFISLSMHEASECLNDSPLTIDCFLAVLRIVGNLDSYLVFKKEPGALLIDCSSKNIFFKISFGIESSVFDKDIQDVAENLSRKINVFLSPYGSHCVIRETKDLIQQRRSFAFLLTLNRIELFSMNETSEQVNRHKRNVENVL